METVRLLGPILQTAYQAQSLTICIQDGPEAGQTVPHVHVHVMPRKKGDFEQNDEIYRAIEAPRNPRTPEAMALEAAILRPLCAGIPQLLTHKR